MLSIWQSVVIIILAVALALSFLSILRHAWDPERRREHNDLVGWQVSVLGTTYAVIIGFMLYAVWTNFQAARVNAEAEANCLANLFRYAAGLPPADGAALRKIARDYARVTIDEEWPAMARESFSPNAIRLGDQLWATLVGTHAQDPTQQIVLSQALSELTAMTHHRRVRELQSRSKIPGILWAVLLVGGVLTIGSSCLFGTRNFRLHFLQVFALSLMISLALVAIEDLDRPFQGGVHVSPSGFSLALQTFDRLSSTSM